MNKESVYTHINLHEMRLSMAKGAAAKDSEWANPPRSPLAPRYPRAGGRTQSITLDRTFSFYSYEGIVEAPKSMRFAYPIQTLEKPMKIESQWHALLPSVQFKPVSNDCYSRPFEMLWSMCAFLTYRDGAVQVVQVRDGSVHRTPVPGGLDFYAIDMPPEGNVYVASKKNKAEEYARACLADLEFLQFLRLGYAKDVYRACKVTLQFYAESHNPKAHIPLGEDPNFSVVSILLAFLNAKIALLQTYGAPEPTDAEEKLVIQRAAKGLFDYSKGEPLAKKLLDKINMLPEGNITRKAVLDVLRDCWILTPDEVAIVGARKNVENVDIFLIFASALLRVHKEAREIEDKHGATGIYHVANFDYVSDLIRDMLERCAKSEGIKIELQRKPRVTPTDNADEEGKRIQELLKANVNFADLNDEQIPAIFKKFENAVTEERKADWEAYYEKTRPLIALYDEFLSARQEYKISQLFEGNSDSQEIKGVVLQEKEKMEQKTNALLLRMKEFYGTESKNPKIPKDIPEEMKRDEDYYKLASLLKKQYTERADFAETNNFVQKLRQLLVSLLTALTVVRNSLKKPPVGQITLSSMGLGIVPPIGLGAAELMGLGTVEMAEVEKYFDTDIVAPTKPVTPELTPWLNQDVKKYVEKGAKKDEKVSFAVLALQFTFGLYPRHVFLEHLAHAQLVAYNRGDVYAPDMAKYLIGSADIEDDPVLKFNGIMHTKVKESLDAFFKRRNALWYDGYIDIVWRTMSGLGNELSKWEGRIAGQPAYKEKYFSERYGKPEDALWSLTDAGVDLGLFRLLKEKTKEELEKFTTETTEEGVQQQMLNAERKDSEIQKATMVLNRATSLFEHELAILIQTNDQEKRKKWHASEAKHLDSVRSVNYTVPMPANPRYTEKYLRRRMIVQNVGREPGQPAKKIGPDGHWDATEPDDLRAMFIAACYRHKYATLVTDPFLKIWNSNLKNSVIYDALYLCELREEFEAAKAHSEKCTEIGIDELTLLHGKTPAHEGTAEEVNAISQLLDATTCERRLFWILQTYFRDNAHTRDEPLIIMRLKVAVLLRVCDIFERDEVLYFQNQTQQDNVIRVLARAHANRFGLKEGKEQAVVDFVKEKLNQPSAGRTFKAIVYYDALQQNISEIYDIPEGKKWDGDYVFRAHIDTKKKNYAIEQKVDAPSGEKSSFVQRILAETKGGFLKK